jgi:hypothetical protein
MRRERFARKQAQEPYVLLWLQQPISTRIELGHLRVWYGRWEQVVNSTFTQQDWLENFCMSRSTFLYHCDVLWSGIEKQNTIMRRAVSTEKRVALTWFLATGADYRTIAHLFGVSKSTICVVTKVCAVIVEHLLPEYVKIPTLKVVIDEFKNNLGFPVCWSSRWYPYPYSIASGMSRRQLQ